MIAVGCTAAVAKAIIGIILLSKMKNKLYKPYQLIHCKIKITIIITLLVMGFSAILNFSKKVPIYWVYVILRKSPDDENHIISFVSSILLFIAEIFLF